MVAQRLVERLRFDPADPQAVVASMARLAEAGGGWINVVPVVADDDDDGRPTGIGFWTLFSGGSIGVTMATWIPAGPRQEVAELGITHNVGRKAVDELAARAVPVPRTWTVRQDHRRRGLVLQLPADEPHRAVLDWAMLALGALGTAGLVRGWRADIYSPSAS